MSKKLARLRQHNLLALTFISSLSVSLSIQAADDGLLDMRSSSGLEIIEQFPTDLENKVVVSASMSFTFNQKITRDSFNANSAISLRERDNGTVIEGTSKLVTNNTIEFTPNIQLDHQKFYEINVSSELQSIEGNTFAGQSTTFATLFDIGNTSQAVINKCGNIGAIRHIRAITKLRNGDSSRCTSFGHPTTTPVSLSCDLTSVAIQAAQTKAGTLNTFTGGFNPAFNYDQALVNQGVDLNTVTVENIPVLAVNGPTRINDFYNRLGGRACDIVMNPNITEVGALLGSVPGRFRNNFVFFEGIFTSKN